MFQIDSQFMLKILRDPAWQIALTLFAAWVAYRIYRLQKGHRELAFGTISKRSLLSISEELSGRVVVTLDEKPVENLHLIVFGLKNSGTESILPRDFDRPTILSFKENVEVLSWQVIKEHPTNLRAEVTLKNNQFEVMPLLLNCGDYITLQALVSAENPSISADIRILDIDHPVPLINSIPPVTLLQGLKNLTFNLIIPMSIIFSLLIFFESAPKGMDYKYLILFIIISYLASALMLKTLNYLDKPSRRIDET